MKKIRWKEETQLPLGLRLFFLRLFIYLEKGRAHMRVGEGAERERQRQRQRILSRPHTVSAEPDAGLKPTNCEIAT